MIVRLLFFFSVVMGSAGVGAQTPFYAVLADSAATLSKDRVIYDPAYYSIPYPNGDIPDGKGVCTDVVIRAYRKLGIDLQREVHLDMRSNFQDYPNNWGLTGTDRNIDHRRVPNLMTFFTRKGQSLEMTSDPGQYMPGDVVTWDLGGGVTHIGIVVKRKSRDGNRHLIMHNIGRGQVIEDCLFDFEIIGHYRYGAAIQR